MIGCHAASKPRGGLLIVPAHAADSSGDVQQRGGARVQQPFAGRPCARHLGCCRGEVLPQAQHLTSWWRQCGGFARSAGPLPLEALP